MTKIVELPRVATLATMASRVASLEQMLPSVLGQFDHIFIYLDGHSTIPAFLRGLERTTLRSNDELHGLNGSSRMLCLKELSRPAILFMIDDDILYPSDYADRLAGALDGFGGGAIVGVHGRIFLPPHRSYIEDVRCFHFRDALGEACHVHELGTGTSAFASDRLAIDPTGWDRTNMDDIMLAIEAQKRSLPRVALKRGKDWLRPIAVRQEDSLWKKTLADHGEQDIKMRELLALYR